MLARMFLSIRRLVLGLHYRLIVPSLRMARLISVENSTVNFLGRSNFRGGVQLMDAVLQIGEGCVVHRTAHLAFCGNGSGFYAGANVEIGAYADIGGGGVVSIGDFTTMAPSFKCVGDVSIGKNALIAPNVFISSGSHIAKSRELIRYQDEQFIRDHGFVFSEPVVIGDDCWLGVNSVICPGVTLGNGCVVGAGSVVTKSFPEYTIVAGVPAKVIGRRQ